jgi:hypothetical protein
VTSHPPPPLHPTRPICPNPLCDAGYTLYIPSPLLDGLRGLILFPHGRNIVRYYTKASGVVTVMVLSFSIIHGTREEHGTPQTLGVSSTSAKLKRPVNSSTEQTPSQILLLLLLLTRCGFPRSPEGLQGGGVCLKDPYNQSRIRIEIGNKRYK